jgi:urease accessory protein
VRADLRGVTASLEATFSCRAGEAKVSSSPPLELRGPFAERDDPPLFMLKNVTAGVFAGDRYDVTLRAEGGARVRVAAPSATKVHAMPDGCAVSRLTIEAETGSLVVYGPAPLILHRDSDFRQSTRICVAPGATAIFCEVIAFGRLASGERLALRRFSSELSVMVTDGETYHECFTLEPGEDAYAIDSALGGYGALGTLVAAGVDEALANEIRSRLPELPGSYAGVSALPAGGGLIVKVLAARMGAAVEVLRAAERAILAIRR